jgi:hypothetical protein
MGKSSPPAQDFRGAAQEQAASSRETLEAQNFANRGTVNTPFGQQSFDVEPQFDPVTGQFYNTFTQNINLTPELQASLDSQQRVQTGRSQAAEGLLGRVRDEFSRPIDFSGSVGLDMRPLQNNFSPEAIQRQLQDPTQQVDSSQRYFDRSEDAVYNQFSRRAEPRFAEESEDLRSQLYSQGLKEGDEAYDREVRRLRENQNDARLQAQDQATQTAGSEAARMFGMDLSNRQQQFGESQGRGAFANQAAEQALRQQFGISDAEINVGNFQNSTRQQQIAEEMQRRGYSLNELNALLGGQQVNNPQFPGFVPSGRGSETNFLGAAQAQGQNNLDIFNANQAQQQGTASAATSLALLLAFSDRRLKTDIKPLGEKAGRKIYSFRYLWSPQAYIGVMADENPDIAVEGPHGYMMVDYGRL